MRDIFGLESGLDTPYRVHLQNHIVSRDARLRVSFLGAYDEYLLLRERSLQNKNKR